MIEEYNNDAAVHVYLQYLLLISTMDVTLLEAPESGLRTEHCSATLLSRPSGVHVNTLPLTVRPLNLQE